MSHIVTKIAIDPRFRFSYITYYIAGFRQLYADKLAYEIADSNLSLSEIEDFRCGSALAVYYSDGVKRKVFLDISDHSRIYEKFYLWSDVYAKINVKGEDLSREKLLHIGPSFGVSVWNPIITFCMCIRNYIKVLNAKNNDFRVPFKTYLADYMYSVIRRLPLSAYCPELDCPQKDYVFTLNTLWYDSLTYSLANKFRGVFIRICQKMFPKFEGGFRIIDQPAVYEEFPKYKEYFSLYSDIITKQRVSLREYLSKTYRSFVVFNVPSVSGCHGWKLCEYFAMGKVIISMPLINAIPEEQRFKQCILLVHDEQEIENSIQRLISSEELRNVLRENVRSYYRDVLSPISVALKIVESSR